MKDESKVITLVFSTVFIAAGIAVFTTVKLGLWHNANYAAVGSITSGIAALTASCATLLAVMGLRKAEKSTRFSVVKDIEAATREVFYALTDVRTEVYRCVRNIAEIEKNKGREESRRQPIPLEIKAACMKFDYACDLLYLRKIDFTDTKHDEKFAATADFTACVMFLVWLSCRIQLDHGQLTVSMGDTEDFKQFFESDFVNEEGGSPYHIQNPRTLEMVRKWFYAELDKNLVPRSNSDITEVDPLYILVITVLMDRFTDLLVSSFEGMVDDLEIGFADLFKY